MSDFSNSEWSFEVYKYLENGKFEQYGT